jgi:hypothetical protein
MKTTIDISKSLFEEAWKLAERRGMTFKEIIEAALHKLLKTERSSPKPFKLRWHTFRGKGLVEGLSEGDWPEIRRRIYEGRGG